MPVAKSPAQELRNEIPVDQKSILNVFAPTPAEQCQPGVGKFVVFTDESIDKGFIAGAWECIPSRPDIPLTKRAEFGYLSWTCQPLLSVWVADDSYGMHPRFASLSVPTRDKGLFENLYDINYRNWDVRCIWQGKQLTGFGVMGDSIFCRKADG